MSEINCKYINSCYLSKENRYIKKDMLIEIKYYPKNIYARDNRLIFIFNDNIIKKLTVWNTIIKALINFKTNDVIFPMSNLKNKIKIKPGYQLKEIKKILERTSNFKIINTINYIISYLNKLDFNSKKEIDLIIIGYEDCLNDTDYDFRNFFLKIFSSLNNKDNIKLKLRYFEYTLDEELNIYKLLYFDKNIEYSNFKYSYKNNENFNSDLKKIIYGNLKDDEITCNILKIHKNLNYNYKIPLFNLKREDNYYKGNFIIPFDLNKDIDSKFAIDLKINNYNFENIFVNKFNVDNTMISDFLKFSILLKKHYLSLRYYIDELYNEILCNINKKENKLNRELYSKFRIKYLIIKERLHGIKRTIKKLMLEEYFEVEILNSLYNDINVNLKNINENIFNCGIKLLEVNDFPLKDNFIKMLENYNGKFKNKRHEEIIFNIIKRNISYIYDMGSKLQNTMIEDDMKNFIKSHTNYENYDINKDLFKKSMEIYFSIITHTDWIDEIEGLNAMGLLVKIVSNDVGKLGFNMLYTNVPDVTSTIISTEQILEGHEFFYEKYGKYDDGTFDDNVISGNGIGRGNAIIPLYINKYHWRISKLYLRPMMGIMFNQNPAAFTRKQTDYLYTILNDMIRKTFTLKNYQSDKWIYILFGFYRTCYQIAMENKETKNVVRFVSDFIEKPELRLPKNINSIDELFSKILSVGYKFNGNYKNFLEVCLEEEIRRKMALYFKDINELDKIYNFENLKESIMYELNLIDNRINLDDLIQPNDYNTFIKSIEVNKKSYEINESIIGFNAFYKLMNDKIIPKYGTIHKFMDELDKSYSILNEEDFKIIKDHIKENQINYNKSELDSIINEKFSSHKNFTKYKLIKFYHTYSAIGIEYNEKKLLSFIIQGIIQRNNKKRLMAIKNKKYINPIELPEKVILNTGILISDRFYRYYLDGLNVWKRLDNRNKNINILVPIFKTANLYESIAIINKIRYYINKVKYLLNNTLICKDCKYVEDKINIFKGKLPNKYNEEKYLNMIKINNPNKIDLFDDKFKEDIFKIHKIII